MHGGAGVRRVPAPPPGDTQWHGVGGVGGSGRHRDAARVVHPGSRRSRGVGRRRCGAPHGGGGSSAPARPAPAWGAGSGAAGGRVRRRCRVGGAPAGRRRGPPPMGFVAAPRPADAAGGESVRTRGVAAKPCGPPPSSSLRTATKGARAEVEVGGAVGGAVFFSFFCAYNPPPASSPSHLSATSPKEVNHCNKPLERTSPKVTPAHRECGEQVGCPWT